MALPAAAIRAIAIRNSIKRRRLNTDCAPRARTTSGKLSSRMLAACIEAAGFEQHALR